MRFIDKLTAEARQQYNLVGDGGIEISLLLWYAPTQQTWFFDVKSGDFEANGLQLVNAPNVLRGFRNIISFGFMTVVSDNLEPYYLDDFVTGRVKLYLLNRAEVAEMEARIFE